MSTYNAVPGYTAQVALVEGRHTGGFMVSFAAGHRSIDRLTLVAGQSLPAGALVGLIVASGKVTLTNPAATDGSQSAFGILFDAVDSTTGDAPCAVVVRDCEVNASELNYGALTAAQQTAALAELAASHIIAR